MADYTSARPTDGLRSHMHDGTCPDLPGLTPDQHDTLQALFLMVRYAEESDATDVSLSGQIMHALNAVTPGQRTNRMALEFGWWHDLCAEHGRDLDGCRDDSLPHAYHNGVPGCEMADSRWV